MAGFSEASLEQKLQSLSNSQQSIQTLSLWLIHHRKHARAAFSVWNKALHGAVSTPPRMLTLLYLLNDVLLQGRKKGDDYIAAFQPHLQEAMSLIYGHGDAKVRASAERVLNIWMERQVYAVEELKAVRSRLNQPRLAVRPAPQPAPLTPKVQPDVVEANVHIMPMDLTEGDIDFSSLVLSLKQLEKESPELEALVEKATNLPFVLMDASYIDQIKGDRTRLLKHQSELQAAATALQEGRARLSQHIQGRDLATSRVDTAISQQRLVLSDCQVQLTTSKEKLAQALKVKKEIKVHLASIPSSTLSGPSKSAATITAALSATFVPPTSAALFDDDEGDTGAAPLSELDEPPAKRLDLKLI